MKQKTKKIDAYVVIAADKDGTVYGYADRVLDAAGDVVRDEMDGCGSTPIKQWKIRLNLEIPDLDPDPDPDPSESNLFDAYIELD